MLREHHSPNLNFGGAILRWFGEAEITRWGRKHGSEPWNTPNLWRYASPSVNQAKPRASTSSPQCLFVACRPKEARKEFQQRSKTFLGNSGFSRIRETERGGIIPPVLAFGVVLLCFGSVFSCITQCFTFVSPFQFSTALNTTLTLLFAAKVWAPPQQVTLSAGVAGTVD